MADTKNTTEAPKTEAPKASAKKDSGSVTAVVFVPSGPVPRDQIFKTAITAVRNQIPIVYTLNCEIDKVSDKKTNDGVEGRDYTVKVNYKTDVPGAEPVNIDGEIERLTVPSLSDFNVATQVQDVPDNPK